MSQVILIPRSAAPRPWLARMRQQIRSIVRPLKNLSELTIADRYFSNGEPSNSGVYVSAETAFTFSAVYDAVNQIASDIGKLPLELRKRRKGAGSEPFEDSKLYRLLKYEPNPEMGSMTFRRTLTAHALTLGNGYAEIVRDGTGKPAALWPLTPERVQPFRERDGLGRLGTLKYKIDGTKALDAKDVLHIRGLGFDGYIGYSIIDKARQVIGVALAAERFLGAFFGNGTRFGGVLSSDQDLDEPQKEEVRQAVLKLHEGPDKAFKLLVLGAGFKFEQSGVTPSDSKLDEIRDKAVEDVARFYRLQPYRLGLNKPGTVSYASVEMSNLDYYTGCLLDWIGVWEEETNRKLIAPLESRQQFVKFEVKGFLRGDMKTRFEAYAMALDKGLYSRNEVRDLEDMNPQDGSGGDLYLVQSAQVPLSKVEEMADATIEKTKQPPPAPIAPPKAPAGEPTDGERALDLLRERLEQADAAAAESRRSAEEAIAARHLAEQTGEVVSAEARANEAAAITAAATHLTIAEDLRSQLAAALDAERRSSAALLEATEAKAQAEALVVSVRAETEQRIAIETEARARVDAEIAEAKVALEAAQTASVAQLRELSEAVQQGAALEAKLEAAEQRASEAAAKADADVVAMTDALVREVEAQARADAALVDATATEAERAALEATLAEARADVATLQLSAEASAFARDEAVRQETTARETADQAQAERDALRVNFDAAKEETRAAVAALEYTEQVRATVEARLAEVTSGHAADLATAVDAREQAEREVAALRVQADAADSARTQAETDRAETEARSLAVAEAAERARLESERITAQAAESERRAVEMAASLADATAALERAESERRQIEAADDLGMAGVIAAHRGLVLDVMRRMVERETDRARRAQATPEKLRRWMETFYEGHEDLMRTALLPAVRIHLAFTRSEEDAIELTRRLVQGHVTESQRQLLNVLEGDADEIAASLPALLHRWDMERTSVIADRLMQTELDYARKR